jgi:glucokinase
LLREAREIAGTDGSRAEKLLALGDGTVEGITGLHVTQAAKEGDPAALEAFDVIGRWIGVGLTNLVSVLDPGVFIVGGGVSEAGDLLMSPIQAAFERRLPGSAYRPIAEVRLAELGNDAGLVGAADLARPAA